MATTVGAQNTSFSLRAEVGSFNKAYQDRQYITRSMVSLAVPYTALGFEYRWEDARGNVAGFDVAQTTIAEGKVYNWDQWVQQPFTLLDFISAFVGRDLDWWEWSAGVGALVQVRDFGASAYLQPDGSTQTVKPAGLSWDRRESFTVLTGLLRFLPESGPHVVFALARGELSLTENLLRAQVVWPGTWGRLDAELGFSSPSGYWFYGPGILRSNERITLGWAFGGSQASVGLRLGYLIRPIVADSGEVDFAHRLSLGLDFRLRPY